MLLELPLFACPYCLRRNTVGSASGAFPFRSHVCVHFRYGPTTRSATFRGLCQQASRVRFLSPVLLKLPGFDFYLGGSRPTEHTFHLVARCSGRTPGSASRSMNPSPEVPFSMSRYSIQSGPCGASCSNVPMLQATPHGRGDLRDSNESAPLHFGSPMVLPRS